MAAAKDFITRQAKAGKPFFCWWNGTRMHFRTHVKTEHIGISGQDEYSDGMVEHDMHVGELLKLIDDLGLADNTIVQYSTDNGPHYNTWPDAGTTPFRGEKNSNWEGAFRVPCFISGPAISRRARRSTASSRTRTGCRPSPPPPVRRTSRKSCSRAAWNSTAAPTRTTSTATTCSTTSAARSKDSPRKEFIYVGDDGDVMAIRVGDWKAIYLENRARSTASVARALRPPAPAAALQPAPRSVREVPAQLEHLSRLDDRPGLRARCRCRRSPASSC